MTRVAACQFEPTVGDPATNRERVADLAAAADADVAVFPELCVTGYDLDVAARADRDHAAAYVDVAEGTDTHLVVGVPDRDDDAIYNALAYVTPDGVRARYRKRHPWGEESEVFAAGDRPVTVDTPAGRMGFLLCYDLNFPERALEYARRECDLLAVSAAWRESYREDWSLLARARALDGTCYVVAANHAGDQRGREHAGDSLVAGPDGRVLARADEGAGIAAGETTDEALSAARERNPVLAARRDARSDGGDRRARSCPNCGGRARPAAGSLYCPDCDWRAARPAD